MLALTRKKGESIMIGDNIEITVISIRGDHVRLGINAPRSVPVHRQEIFEQIVKSNKEAVTQLGISQIAGMLKADKLPTIEQAERDE